MFRGACMPPHLNWDKHYGVAIVQDLGQFHGVETVAHEIGHLLGARHDGDQNTCCSDEGYMMNNVWTTERHAKRQSFKWSRCSVEYIETFLKHQTCLFNIPARTPYPLMEWEDLRSPNVPSLKDQCSIHYVKSGILSLF